MQINGVMPTRPAARGDARNPYTPQSVKGLIMQETAKAVRSMKLDETALIDELKRLRQQIPDNPSLNPILNVAFDL